VVAGITSVVLAIVLVTPDPLNVIVLAVQVAVFGIAGAVAWSVALPMAAGQLAGGVVGARLAIRGGARLIRIAVLVVSAALTVKLVLDLV